MSTQTPPTVVDELIVLQLQAVQR